MSPTEALAHFTDKLPPDPANDSPVDAADRQAAEVLADALGHPSQAAE